MRHITSFLCALGCTLATVLLPPPARAEEKRLHILFLGDRGHHRPRERADQLIPVMQKRGIDVVYTERMADLNPETLGKYDGLIIYANVERIEPGQEKALLDFVAGGKGFIPLHCASYCFLNSGKYVELVGAQFRRHGTGTFGTRIEKPDHPIMKGFGGFESWDETYEHTRHNEKDRVVLDYREREPWTWVRTHGKGRVFYTAWGHDHRTWGNPGFQNLVERGIRWAVGDDPSVVPEYVHSKAPSGNREEVFGFPVPEMTTIPKDLKPFEYTDVGNKIPNYTPGARWGVQGRPLNLMQKPAPAEESMKHMVTPVGFEVKLFASDPDIGKPLCMTWDERGRLWLCETVDYPNELRRPGEGNDRIRICEDTDGDGKADKFTVFAEKLSIPTAITRYRGGVIVQDGVQTLYFKDTDGDDKADVRKVLITGWALGDTHGGVSNFRYGLDNWIWAMQGYNNSRPSIEGERQQGFRQGFFRLKLDNADPPKVTELEFLRSTDNNTWGLGISEEGLIFGSTANRNPSVFMPIPNRYYERVRGWSAGQLRMISDTHLFKPITDRVRQVDHHGGYTAGAGHALYTARTYPREYWNRTAFVCGPTGHLVGTFVLQGEGAGFKSKNAFNLLASDDEWTAPIMAEVGPDGNVWVIDWYNFIVQHNPTPAGFRTGRGAAYETDLRDKKHGRVYRVVAKDGKVAPSPKLADASGDVLVQALKHPTMFWRLQAQRLLVERGNRDVVPALMKLAEDRGVDEIGLNAGVTHALWTLQGLGALEVAEQETPDVLPRGLTHESAGVRRAALMVLPRVDSSPALILKAESLDDKDAQVRLAALLALADLPCKKEAESQVAAAIAKMLLKPENYNDRWIRDAATSAGARYDHHFLHALASVREEAPAPVLEVATTVADHFARGTPAEQVSGLLAALAQGDAKLAEAVIAGLGRGWPRGERVALDEKANAAIGTLLSRLPAGGRGQLVKLAQGWGAAGLEQWTKETVSALVKIIEDGKRTDRERSEAARQLVEFLAEDEQVVEQILKLITPQASPDLVSGLLTALGSSTANNVGEAILGHLPSMTPAMKTSAFSVLLLRADSTRTLLDALEAGKVQIGELSLDQKQALQRHPSRLIARRATRLLERSGGLPNPDREKVLQELLPLVKAKGDPMKGKAVFKEHCAKCHTHSGEGAKVGPDLTGMAVHPKEELLTQVIDPSRSVEGNYRVYTLELSDGRILSGMLAAETRTSLEVIDVEGKSHAVQRSDVEGLFASDKSLMPDGFEKTLKPEQVTDLLEFMTHRGKYLPLDLSKVATIVSTKGMFYDENASLERLIFPDWSPRTFEGVPFVLVDPRGDRVRNVVMLHGPQGKFPPTMPRSVTLTCNSPAKAIHFLSGVSGWGAKAPRNSGSVSMIVRLHYQDGKTEDHNLMDGRHFADYIGEYDVPESKLAFKLRGQQIRYLAIQPQRREVISTIELVKGSDRTAPIVMAVTVEGE